MKRVIRKILRDTFAYTLSAEIYHRSRNLITRISLIGTGTIYLKPKKPAGKYKSQFGQDYYLEKYGLVPPHGTFIEVGCNHPVTNSNSYYLETHLNYRGASIDGIDYSDLFKEYRPQTRFIHALIDETAGEADFYQVVDEAGWENQVSSMHKETLKTGKGFTAEIRRVKTMPLRDLACNKGQIDLILIDVEGHELSVLKSIDWDLQAPQVLVVENNGDFYPRKDLKKYMRTKGYKLFARLGSSDDFYVKFGNSPP